VRATVILANVRFGLDHSAGPWTIREPVHQERSKQLAGHDQGIARKKAPRQGPLGIEIQPGSSGIVHASSLKKRRLDNREADSWL
jgi:hypothetical protein